MDIAVCWFTHRDIFDTLINLLEQGITIHLIIEYDTQNIKENGLDFQKFIAKGGKLWAAKGTRLMHHKFAIIDQKTLLTGSFNWTYNDNAENLIACHDGQLITAFKTEFDTQKQDAKRVYVVRAEDAKSFVAFPLFERTQFSIPELRKQVSRGAGVWVFRLDLFQKEGVFDFKANHLPFDHHGFLFPFWVAYRMWDLGLFKHELDNLNHQCTPIQIRDLRRWILRMNIGDLILAVQDKTRLMAIGIVQSEPQASDQTEFSSIRQVQWIYHFQEKIYTTETPAHNVLSKYKGSALRLLDQVALS